MGHDLAASTNTAGPVLACSPTDLDPALALKHRSTKHQFRGNTFVGFGFRGFTLICLKLETVHCDKYGKDLDIWTET